MVAETLWLGSICKVVQAVAVLQAGNGGGGGGRLLGIQGSDALRP